MTARALAARGGVAALAALVALVMACGSSSTPGGSDAGQGFDAGFGTDAGGGDGAVSDSSGDASTDVASDGPLCTAIGTACDPSSLCCGGSMCLAVDGGTVCTFPLGCLTSGQPCSATESCCNGAGDCGEGTTNICL